MSIGNDFRDHVRLWLEALVKEHGLQSAQADINLFVNGPEGPKPSRLYATISVTALPRGNGEGHCRETVTGPFPEIGKPETPRGVKPEDEKP